MSGHRKAAGGLKTQDLVAGRQLELELTGLLVLQLPLIRSCQTV